MSSKETKLFKKPLFEEQESILNILNPKAKRLKTNNIKVTDPSQKKITIFLNKDKK